MAFKMPWKSENSDAVVSELVTNYDPDAAVADFTRKFGVFGREVLYAYNDNDPLNIGVGDYNQDEYLHEAEQFFAATLTLRGVHQSVYETLVDDYEYIENAEIQVFNIASDISNVFDALMEK